VPASATNRYAGGPSPSGLADVLDLILDKGLVIDVYVRVSVVGIELLTIDARIVVASVDTYLRFAEAVGRLNLEETGAEKVMNLPDRARSSAISGGIDGVKEGIFGTQDEAETANR
jgi:hypothetical protein